MFGPNSNSETDTDTQERSSFRSEALDCMREWREQLLADRENSPDEINAGTLKQINCVINDLQLIPE